MVRINHVFLKKKKQKIKQQIFGWRPLVTAKKSAPRKNMKYFIEKLCYNSILTLFLLLTLKDLEKIVNKHTLGSMMSLRTTLALKL